MKLGYQCPMPMHVHGLLIGIDLVKYKLTPVKLKKLVHVTLAK